MGKLETRPRLVRRWLEFTSDWFSALSRTFQPIAKHNNVNCDQASSPDPPPAYLPEVLVRAAARFRGRFSKVPITFRARKAVLGLPCLQLTKQKWLVSELRTVVPFNWFWFQNWICLCTRKVTWPFEKQEPGARKSPGNFWARNQIFKSKYKE